MPSQRRAKAAGALILLTILILLYMSSSARSTRDSAFYQNTVAAMDARVQKTNLAQAGADAKAQAQEVAAKAQEKVGGGVEEIARLRDDVVAGVGKAAPDSPIPGLGAEKEESGGKQRPLADEVKDAVHGVAVSSDGEKSVAGRKMMKEGGGGAGGKIVEAEGATDDGVAKVGNVGNAVAEKSSKADAGPETEEDHEVEIELNAILKKSPIIIFSKSYCPYSLRAKKLLLQTYKIVPAPYVVELDQHPLGPQLQAALHKSTGRRTVPNILINGKSIGGGDDVQALDAEDRLADVVSSMGGKRVMEVTRVEAKVPVEPVARRFRG